MAKLFLGLKGKAEKNCGIFTQCLIGYVSRLQKVMSFAIGCFLRVTCLPVATDNPLIGGEFLESHRSAGVHLLGAYANLGSEAELSAIGEGCAGVHVAASGIDLIEEGLGGLGVFGYNGFGVFAAVGIDVFHGFLKSANGHNGHAHGHELTIVVLGLNVFEQVGWVMTYEGSLGTVVGFEFYTLIGKGLTEFGQVLKTSLMNNETVQGIADTHAAGLGIADYGLAFLQIASQVEKGVHNARTSFNDWHLGVVSNRGNESGRTSRDEQIDIAYGFHEVGGGLVVVGQQLNQVGVETLLSEDLLYNLHQLDVAVVGIASALENQSVARTKAYRNDVDGDVGSGLVDDANDSHGDSDAANLKSVGHGAGVDDLATWGGQMGHVAGVLGNAAKAGGVQFQTVVEGIGGVHASKVEGISLYNFGGSGLESIGQSHKDFGGLEGRYGAHASGGSLHGLELLFCLFHFGGLWDYAFAGFGDGWDKRGYL